MFNYKFTVFTPSFNRADTLHRVFESLQIQSYRDFEWLIIDDGSTDATKSVVEEFKLRAHFPIRYVYQNNTHKYVTLLRGAEMASGEFFYSVDSDDEILPNALEVLHETWLTIPEDKKENFSGVTGLCIDQYGQLIGSKFPQVPFDSDSLECAIKYRISGEKSGFQKTELLRQFSADSKFEQNGYIPEGILWISLANKGYKTRYINQVLRKYYINAGHSIMTSANFESNAFGTYQYSKLFLNSFRWYYFYNPKQLLGQTIKFTAAGWLQGYSSFELFKQIKTLIIKIVYIISIPMSYLYSLNANKN